MKNITILSILVMFLSLGTACTGNDKNTTETATVAKQSEKVEVYYFHNARRCATCKAVEAEAKKAIEELYGNRVLFAAYNLEEAEGEQKAKDLGVSGQTLLIVNGDTKINITNEGFMNARNNVDKFKAVIKEKIDPLVN
ncbi:MAG: nitrophenyl compound nitroreductase subunit ArsF family protein [Salinivirgaceae bacterium]|jgi:hypothetical protein|nr:nitrophenyl compound nitroreductase subunit ArsF family protein [Salinivirgaceae bacterium]